VRHDGTFDTPCSRAGAGLHRGSFCRTDRHLARRRRDKCRRHARHDTMSAIGRAVLATARYPLASRFLPHDVSRAGRLAVDYSGQWLRIAYTDIIHRLGRTRSKSDLCKIHAHALCRARSFSCNVKMQNVLPDAELRVKCNGGFVTKISLHIDHISSPCFCYARQLPN
jgi:hypothetical protein